MKKTHWPWIGRIALCGRMAKSSNNNKRIACITKTGWAKESDYPTCKTCRKKL